MLSRSFNRLSISSIGLKSDLLLNQSFLLCGRGLNLNLLASFSQRPSTYRLPKEQVTFQRDSRLPKRDAPPVLMPEDIEQWVENFDTTITPEQKEKVERLKRKIRGPKTPQNAAREPMTRAQFEKTDFGGPAPLLPSNAEALIDYALSFIPERLGPRRSRAKKRLAHRLDQSKKDHQRRIKETQAARIKKQATKAKQYALMNEIRTQAGLAPLTPRPKGKKANAEQKQ